ncbi:MAG: Cof-type HAD-IIB family hydrolase [Lachnospiraceae bacterium]|nr:Cof-type HAD-IIB family hydrolase [Lachnospiraceae bacterium]
MIKAIFFDVDGTLLSHKTKRIPPDAENALEALRAKGIKIFMATGRHFTELLQLPVNHIKFDGYVTLNGRLCLDTNGEILRGTPFDKELSEKLIAIFERKRYPLVLVEAQRIYINFVNDEVCKALENVSTSAPEVGLYRGDELYQASMFLKEEEEIFLGDALPEHCKFVRWNEDGVDIISANGGKSEGIRYFCECFGIRQSEVMAFGDAENDIDMLRFAQIGVAMGNAQDCVKKEADYVTADVDEGGIEKALRFLGVIS